MVYDATSSYNLIDTFWTTQAWITSYQHNLLSVLRSALVVDKNMESPARQKQKQKGRPRNKRREKS